MGIEALTVRPARSEVDGGGAEQQPNSTQDDRLRRELGGRFGGRYVRPERACAATAARECMAAILHEAF